MLIFFDKLYSVMDDQEKRQLMESLLSEVQIYEERQPNGQWLKSIKFKLPIIAQDMSLSLDNDAHIETVVGLHRKDKFCIVDLDYVMHGSYNWSKNANYNEETLATALDREFVSKFADEFMEIYNEIV